MNDLNGNSMTLWEWIKRALEPHLRSPMGTWHSRADLVAVCLIMSLTVVDIAAGELTDSTVMRTILAWTIMICGLVLVVDVVQATVRGVQSAIRAKRPLNPERNR